MERLLNKSGIVPKLPESSVAHLTEQATDLESVVAVVDLKSPSLFLRCPTDGTSVILRLEDGEVLGGMEIVPAFSTSVSECDAQTTISSPTVGVGTTLVEMGKELYEATFGAGLRTRRSGINVIMPFELTRVLTGLADVLKSVGFVGGAAKLAEMLNLKAFGAFFSGAGIGKDGKIVLRVVKGYVLSRVLSMGFPSFLRIGVRHVVPLLSLQSQLQELYLNLDEVSIASNLTESR